MKRKTRKHAKRKKNPIFGFPVPGDPGYVAPTAPKPSRKRTRKQREKLDRVRQYKERVKRMRPFFKDVFSVKTGFDLRRPQNWTPAQKAKVTKYFRVIAPNITGNFITKRYRISENIKAAVDASLQEKKLKGQTAVAFRVDPGEKLEVTVKKGKATVKQAGINRTKILFNMKDFVKTPKKELNRVLKLTDANVFRLLVGSQGQNKTLTRADLVDEVVRIVENYSPKNVRRSQNQKPFTEWLNGLIAFDGTKGDTYTAVDKFVQRHKKVMKKKRRDHLDTLAAKTKGVSVSTLRRQRTIAKKKKATIDAANRRGLGKRVR